MDFERDWIDDARRYFTNIVGKYGPHVQALLKKKPQQLILKLSVRFTGRYGAPTWATLSINTISGAAMSRRRKGVMIAYASMYGNTEAAAQALASKLCEKRDDECACI